jgi:type I restriction enzyme S subunit
LQLTSSSFLDIPVLKPPVGRQNAIVEFLDKRMEQIGDFIRKKEKLINLLSEQKKSLLFQIVTKGRIETSEHKSPDWRVSLPSEWSLRRLRYCVSSITGGITPSMDNQSYWDGNITWISSKDMKSEFLSDSELRITEKALRSTAIKLIEPNAVLVVARSGILQHTLPVAINTSPVTINQDLKAIRVCPKIFRPDYFALVLRGLEPNILHECVKSVATVESLELSYFKNVLIPVPPLDIQPSLIEWVSERFASIGSSIDAAKREISAINEYANSLITNAVTGERFVGN